MKTKWFCAIALSVASFVASAEAKDEFVAHEWGTFTSVQGADGIQIQWNPLIRTDLPDFVYNNEGRSGFPVGLLPFEPKGFTPAFVRMETPVIYFYSKKERTVDVNVKYPLGRITEWYPQATRIGPYTTTNKAELPQANRAMIEWKGLKILPRGTREISAEKLIRGKTDKGESHYYAARETDANFLRMAAPYARTGVEHERDLFYRGVGYSQAPLAVKLGTDENELRISTKTVEPVKDLFVLTIRRGMARYQHVNSVNRDEEHAVKLDAKPFAPLSDVRESIMREMAAALTKQGLYAKEAQAMVNTWKDQWFEEEGTRVLYLLPRYWTDQSLPLEISPRPNNVARVMVGRAEVIMPSIEQELSRQVTIYSQGDADVKIQALNEVRALGLGRFLEPATRKMLGKSTDKAFVQAAWMVAQEVSKLADGKAPTVVEKQLGPVLPKTASVSETVNVPNFASF